MRALLPEEMAWTLHNACRGSYVLRPGDEAWPQVAAADQPCRHRVGQGVGDFLQHSFGVCEKNRAIGPRSPEGLGAAVEGIECPSDKEVEAVLEEGEVAVGVSEDDVVVVGENHVGVQEDAVAVCSEGEAVEDDVIDEWVWFEEEAALRAASCDEVG